VARGDLNRKITVDVKGEILELKNTINTMVDQLNAFAGEVSRWRVEVGTEGKLGGQAVVRAWPVPGGISPTTSTPWLRTHRTGSQHCRRGDGYRARRLEPQDHRRRKGEILQLKETGQHDGRSALRIYFGSHRVAREVGTEGKLGGQATVSGRRHWKDLPTT